MTILLTGGAGYIGSIIAELLVEEGQQVVVYDNLSQGHRQAVPQRAHLVVGELADRDRLLHTLQSYGVDVVIHLAARSLVGESYADPQSYYRENLVTSLILLEAMREAGVRKMVFSSTAAVYGEPREIPITEEHPELPSNPYGETKLAVERTLCWYKEAYSLQYCSLRYFNAAGATLERGEDHRPETHLIPLTLSVALGQRDYLEIYGDNYDTPDGTCLRDYIHVVDLAQAHLLALERLVDTKSVSGGVREAALQEIRKENLSPQSDTPRLELGEVGDDAGLEDTARTKVKTCKDESLLSGESSSQEITFRSRRDQDNTMGNISPIYNLGNERAYSVREIIKVAEEVTGRPIPTKIAPRRRGDPSVLVASSEKIKKELGWRPQHQDIYEIVESAWKWHKRHPRGYEEER